MDENEILTIVLYNEPLLRSLNSKLHEIFEGVFVGGFWEGVEDFVGLVYEILHDFFCVIYSA